MAPIPRQHALSTRRRFGWRGSATAALTVALFAGAFPNPAFAADIANPIPTTDIPQQQIAAGLVNITGAKTIGATLTANTSKFKPKPQSYDYVWYRNGEQIGDGVTYSLTIADAGTDITVQVIAKSDGFADSLPITSAPVSIEKSKLPFTATGKVTITGDKTVGAVLTADIKGFKPAPTSYTYTWYRTTKDGTAKVGSGATYTLKQADLAQQITVQVIAKADGYLDSTTVESSPFTVTGQLTSGKVSISGDKAVGAKLTATPAGFKPAPASFTYAWYRNGTTKISAQATYTLKAEDAGQEISVRVIAKVPNYSDSEPVTASAGVIPAVFSGGKVAISGTKTIGSVLTANPKGFKPVPASYTYAWYRNGTTLVGTEATYTVQPADDAQRITVRIVAKADAILDSDVIVSAPVAIQKGEFSSGQVLISGLVEFNGTLTANPSGFDPGATSYRYNWYRDGTKLIGTKSTYKVTAADVGAQISVRIIAKADGYKNSPEITSPSVYVIAPSNTGARAVFDPGFFISDNVMYDYNAMTLAEIRSFIETQGVNCVSDGTNICLKHYRETTLTRPPTPYCPGGYQGAANESAADIIYKVATSCRINPQVLLVTLQKEQSLIKQAKPASVYLKALGFACADGQNCLTEYAGFANQVYAAASQIRKYDMDQYGNYHPGQYNNILYSSNPSLKCGASPVFIQSQATASLYNYTPYQPNLAALLAYPSAGNSCSEYGNRNFFFTFNAWFGDPRR